MNREKYVNIKDDSEKKEIYKKDAIKSQLRIYPEFNSATWYEVEAGSEYLYSIVMSNKSDLWIFLAVKDDPKFNFQSFDIMKLKKGTV